MNVLDNLLTENQIDEFETEYEKWLDKLNDGFVLPEPEDFGDIPY